MGKVGSGFTQADGSQNTLQKEFASKLSTLGVNPTPNIFMSYWAFRIMMGLGYALTEEIHFEGGKILDTNFDTYALPRFSWMPKIETVIIEANEQPPQGGGEPTIILMGAVVALQSQLVWQGPPSVEVGVQLQPPPGKTSSSCGQV